MNNKETLIKTAGAVELLQSLIQIPSFSRQEAATADLLMTFLQQKGVETHRHLHNVWATNRYYDPAVPTILLNSHHDTVRPNDAYTRNPFGGEVEGEKLFGLGSNDAGASLIALLYTFLHFYEQKNLAYNLLFAATAEEEISGAGGIESLLPLLPAIDCGIVGEPTGMQLAVAERGLMVLDVYVEGKAGHAARNEGENAIYKALPDIDWCKRFQFEKTSDLLGPVQLSVTVIHTENQAHNVVPASCHFVVDVRVNECYTLDEVLAVIRANLRGRVEPRSLRLKSTFIVMDHPLVKAGQQLGKTCYGSPTTSDKALMPFPVLKMGPGDSLRSHTADEYIFLEELQEGIHTYINLLNQVL